MAPDRQHSVDALLVMCDHRFYHILFLLRLHQREERMLCPVCIPEGEYRVVVESFSLVYAVVETAVAAVYVHINGRIDHRVVERGVEHLLLVLGAGYVYAREFLLPGILSL